MKKIIITIGSLLLIATNVAVAQPSAADQKWAAVVEKMVEHGKTKFSTSNETRVKLIKSWAEKHKYAVAVTKAPDASFKLSITRNVARN